MRLVPFPRQQIFLPSSQRIAALQRVAAPHQYRDQISAVCGEAAVPDYVQY